jgi:hypothetical protein
VVWVCVLLIFFYRKFKTSFKRGRFPNCRLPLQDLVALQALVLLPPWASEGRAGVPGFPSRWPRLDGLAIPAGDVGSTRRAVHPNVRGVISLTGVVGHGESGPLIGHGACRLQRVRDEEA